jgi:flagellar hook-basal body complex protein FliE
MELATLALTPVPAVGTPGIQGLPALESRMEPAAEPGAPVLKFQNFLASAIAQTNEMSMEADNAVSKLVTGQDIDLHSVMIAMEKANLSLSLAMQIRNKMVESYQQVMQMQI